MSLGLIIVSIIAVLEAVVIIELVVKSKKDNKSDNGVRNDFLSVMSHEIRTPINAVIGMNEMILREAKEEEIKEYASNIAVSSQMLLSLINDILDYSKIDKGKMEIVNVDFRLKYILNDLINMLSPRAKAKGIDFIYNIDSDIPSGLIGDEIRLKQVLTNLLTNAVKYTHTGNVELYARRISKDGDKAIVKFGVRDTGIGIKPEDIDHVAEAFKQVDKEMNRHIEGTGLGLSITKKLIELMGSELKIESQYGKGSDFYFTMTFKISDESPLGDVMDGKVAIKEGTFADFTVENLRMLVVDDNEINLVVVSNLLKETKATIDTVDNGKEAVELCRQNKYDIIFMDHMMPEMDGIETLKAIKELGDECPSAEGKVIALTANAVSGSREFYAEQGFDDYLTKPIDIHEIYEVVRKYSPSGFVTDMTTEESAKLIHKDNTVNVDGKIVDITDMKPLSTGIINGNLAMKHCHNNMQSYLELLRTFYRDGKTLLDRVKYMPGKLFMAKDMNDFSMKAHTLKSIAEAVGIQELYNVSDELEMAAKTNTFSVMDEKLPVCRELYEQSVSDVEVYLRKYDLLPAEGDVKLPTEAYEKLLIAREKAVEGHTDEALEIINELL